MSQLNPLIPMSVKPLQLGNAILEGREVAQNRVLADQRLKESDARIGAVNEQSKIQQSQEARAKQDAAIKAENYNIRSVASGVLGMQGEIASGDWEAVTNQLQRRAESISRAGGDPTETLEGIELINSGNTEEFKQYADFAVREAFSRGLLAKKQTKYGDVTEVVDPEGNPSLIRFGDDGSVQKVQGFLPKPDKEDAKPVEFVEVVDPSDKSKTKFVPANQKQDYLPKGNVVKPKAAKDRTAGQQKEEGFYDSMVSASQTLDNLEFKVDEKGNKVINDDFDPIVWDPLGLRPNLTIGDDEQRYMQAAKQWSRAKLRSESGATIGEDEEKQEIATYFPVAGDSKEVILQKAAARKTAEQSMRKKAGLKTAQDMTDDELMKALNL